MTTHNGSRLPGSETPKRRLPINATELRSHLPASPGTLWRRVRRPAATFPWTAPTWPGGVPLGKLERELGVDYDTDWARRYPARLARVLITEGLTRPVMHALADPKVEGLDRLAHLTPRDAIAPPVIFAANHASHLDTPLLLSVIPEPWRHRTVVAAGADYFFDTKLKAAAFALAINAIPIERVRVSRASANRAESLLRQGWSLLIYPEGGRSPDGWGQSHRAGAAWLAVRTGLPVVPIHLEGTGRILPRHAKRLRPGSTQVTFGRPVRPAGGEDARDLATRLEQAVAALADERTTDWWSATKRAAGGSSPVLTGPASAGAWRRTWALGERRWAARRVASSKDKTRWPRD